MKRKEIDGTTFRDEQESEDGEHEAEGHSSNEEESREDDSEDDNNDSGDCADTSEGEYSTDED